jgi:hypothetical protein
MFTTKLRDVTKSVNRLSLQNVFTSTGKIFCRYIFRYKASSTLGYIRSVRDTVCRLTKSQLKFHVLQSTPGWTGKN